MYEYSKSATRYTFTAGQHRYTTQQVSNAIHFTTGQHRYHSAGQQCNTNHATLNHNVAEIEIQGKRGGNFATILQQNSITLIYFSRAALPWEWRPQTDVKYG